MPEKRRKMDPVRRMTLKRESDMKIIDCDYLVVGTGIAGMMSALNLSKLGRVIILTKKESAESNTNYAQGGIACVVKPDDSFERHVSDTLRAGDGLCAENVVNSIISKGPERIAELEQLGIEFAERHDAAGDGYDLGKEGGHTKRRVLHAGDITGRHIERALLAQAMNEPNIMMHEQCMVIDLITTGWLKSLSPNSSLLGGTGAGEDNRCAGVYALNRNSGEIFAVRAPYVILATGGGGKVYLYTSNPDIATGDGVAIAWRAGVPVKNMEFIQFHPTCLYHPEARTFLISEAVRGEGAKLVNERGESFVEKYDPRGALASRDIVARAIDSEMKASGADCVYLDIRHQSKSFLMERFPTIYDMCLSYGFDMAKDLVPVVPAAHYFCGGIEAGIDGVTALDGLFACGEVACTGLHGANRLASNSLLEAVVCAHDMVEKIKTLSSPSTFARVEIPDWMSGDAVTSDEAIVVAHNWNEVRTCMWDYVGIVRTNKRLERAARRIFNLRQEIREYYLNYVVTADILELRNIAVVAEVIVRSAQLRMESRGLHYTLDYPERDDSVSPQDTVVNDPAGSRA